MIENAKQWVIDGVRSCTPKDVPLSFTEVISIKTKKNVVVAEVRMFDGLRGVVEVSQVPFGRVCMGWSLYWRGLEGGPVKWDGTRWVRVNKPTKLVQLSFLDEVAS